MVHRVNMQVDSPHHQLRYPGFSDRSRRLFSHPGWQHHRRQKRVVRAALSRMRATMERVGSAPLAAEARHGSNLFHPRLYWVLVEVFHGAQLHTSCRLAHPDWRDRWYGVEQVRSVDEHQLDMASKATATEAPSVADAVVCHPPFHRPLKIWQASGGQFVNRFCDATLGLWEARDIGKNRRITDGCFGRARPAGHSGG